jgi:hypothetical protein
MYSTKIEDFGCIRHSQYEYIGASPDGINCDPFTERYGRMLEIKNVVNRELNGNPTKAYWIQMQMQMETCDLNECDFFETKFMEYESEEAFYDDVESREYKGVILYFVERVSIGSFSMSTNNAPHYVYMPLNIPLNKESIDEWIQLTRQQLRRDWSLYTTLYWYLDDYSCVLVERNRLWFANALPKIEETWNTVLQERVTGYEHRAAKKRLLKINKVDSVVQQDKDSKQINANPVWMKTNSVCLVKL